MDKGTFVMLLVFVIIGYVFMKAGE